MAKQMPSIQSRVWKTSDEIDRAIALLQRRRGELSNLAIWQDSLGHSADEEIALSNFRDSLRDIFGEDSPELRDHGSPQMYVGYIEPGMGPREIGAGKEVARGRLIGIVDGLIRRLQEKKEFLGDSSLPPTPATELSRLRLHPRIAGVATDRFEGGQCWDAVFAASKALVNMVKEKSGRHDLDGAPLVRQVFSRNSPILAFNDLQTATQGDEQEGMMHLFEGAVLGIRNPGGHSFPDGTIARAAEYLSLLSMLAHMVDESKLRST